MRKKFIILFLLLLSLAVLLWKHKSWSVKNIPVAADAIVVIDTKRIVETLLWNYITTPSRWKAGKLFSETEEVSWRQMFNIPDYIVAFHLKATPVKTWYSVLPIKNKDKLDQGLIQHGFSIQNDIFQHPSGLSGKVFNNDLILGNTDINGLSEVAALLEQGNWMEKEFLESAIKDKKHGVLSFRNNPYTENIIFSLKDNIYELTTTLKPETSWKPTSTAVDTAALAYIMMTQPPPAILQLLSEKTKSKINSIINLEIDSLMTATNQYYTLNIQDITAKQDTIVTYVYDDDFNPIEKKETQHITEPSFLARISTSDANQLQEYVVRSGNTEQTDNGLLLTNMPLVKSYLSTNDTSFSIQSYQYKTSTTVQSGDNFLNGFINVAKMPTTLNAWLPDQWQKISGHLNTIRLQGIQENGHSKLILQMESRQ